MDQERKFKGSAARDIEYEIPASCQFRALVSARWSLISARQFAVGGRSATYGKGNTMDMAADPGSQPRLRRRSALQAAAVAGLAAAPLAGLGALAAGVPAAGGTSADPAAARQEAGTPAAPGDPVIAHVRNARTGEIDIFSGTTQVRVHDAALAALIIRAGR
jgi:hypothetical protein